MKTAEILSVTDRTSWSRIYMVFRYFWLRIRWKVAAYIVISVLFGLQARHSGLLSISSQTCSFALSLVIMLGPIMLFKRNDGPLFATLPALGWEKCVAIFSICMILFPVAISLPYNLIVADMSRSLLATMLPEGFEISMPLAYACSILGNCMIISACLWGTLRAKRARAMHGVLMAFVAFLIMIIGVGIISVCIGMAYALNAENPDIALPETSAVAAAVMKAMAVGVSIGFLIFGSLAVRAICRKQY